jgi:hypothetical protein
VTTPIISSGGRIRCPQLPEGFHERDDGAHQGFDGCLDYIERTQPHYSIHCHQHLNLTTKIGETTLIGVYGEAIIEIGASSDSATTFSHGLKAGPIPRPKP